MIAFYRFLLKCKIFSNHISTKLWSRNKIVQGFLPLSCWTAAAKFCCCCCCSWRGVCDCGWSWAEVACENPGAGPAGPAGTPADPVIDRPSDGTDEAACDRCCEGVCTGGTAAPVACTPVEAGVPEPADIEGSTVAKVTAEASGEVDGGAITCKKDLIIIAKNIQ